MSLTLAWWLCQIAGAASVGGDADILQALPRSLPQQHLADINAAF